MKILPKLRIPLLGLLSRDYQEPELNYNRNLANLYRGVIMKLTCAQMDVLISFYIDGGLSSSLKSQVDEHLKMCPTCRAKFDIIKSMITDLKNNLKLPIQSCAIPNFGSTEIVVACQGDIASRSANTQAGSQCALVALCFPYIPESNPSKTCHFLI